MPFLLINKEEGWTSHDVVGYLRKITKIKKIGHAGTLDPFATGLLIIGVEREATKRLDEFKGMKKTYRATAYLGAVSDTYDKTGVLTPQKINTEVVPLPAIERTIKKFIGEQEQLPPMYSAKKIGGKKLYELAREGIVIERKPHPVTFYDIQILDYTFPLLIFEVTCSTGTYIRTLVHDIGQNLGTGAYCESLQRTQIGEYSVKNAQGIKEFSQENWNTFTFVPNCAT